MSLRLLLAPVLVAAFVTPAAAAPKAQVLAGTVRITAKTTTVIDVRLPRAATFGHGQLPKEATVTGAGRIVGVMLLRPGADLNPAVIQMRYGLCDTAGCTSPLGFTYFHVRGETPAPQTIEKVPAGNYRLLVVTDGKPVTAVLKFPGLKGSKTLKSGGRYASTKHYTLDFGALKAPPLQTFYSASEAFVVDGGLGILLHQFTARTDVSAQQQGGFCTYHGSTGAEPAPGCPTGSGNSISIAEVKAEPARWGQVGHMRYLSEGEFRAGPYYRTIGAAHDPVGTLAVVVIPEK